MTTAAGSLDDARVYGGPGPHLHKYRLPNGLRVVLSPHWPSPRAAVAVHYGVGFRSEDPGREGMAHLFEHLMFRGSESLPDGSFFDALPPLAGTANGTTHQDYTDYFQAVPAEALEQALFREADRMRAPRFTPAQLSAQLAEVAREIESVRDGRPYGGLPWPLLPQALFTTFAHAHDGYGDAGALGRVTVEDCAWFFETYYAPSNAVLTVVGPHSADDLRRLVERHFTDVPDRPAAVPPVPPEPAPEGDRLLHRTDPRAPRTAVAVGYRLPDPATDLPAYTAHMVLAALTARTRPADGSPFAARVAAGCGFFGPLDARDPDVLVVTSVLPHGSGPDDFTRDLTAWWNRHTDPRALDRPGPAAAASLAAHHRRDLAELQRRCRTLGRLELLFGRAELTDHLADLIAATTPEQLASAAAALADAPRSTVVVEPGGTGSAPPPGGGHGPASDPASDPGRPSLGTSRAERLARTAEGPRPLPPLGAPVAPALDAGRERVLANGLRMAVVPDRRGGLVEVRLRAALGPWGWRRPAQVAGLLRAADQAIGASARVLRLGGELRLSTDGQWADISGWAPAGDFPALLGIVAELSALRPGTDVAVPAPDRGTGWGAGWGAPLRSPEQRMDEALRMRWLGSPSAAHGPAGGEEWDGASGPFGLVPASRDAALVVVGDVAPEQVLDQAAALLDGRPAAAFREPAMPEPATLPAEPAVRASEPATLASEPAVRASDPATLASEPAVRASESVVRAPESAVRDVLVLREPSDGTVRLALCAPEPPRTERDEPARYLTTALFGGHFGARLAERCRRLERAGHVVFAARDMVAHRPRALVRVTAPRAALADAVRDVREEAAALAAEPPAQWELDVARRYCAAQLLTAFDSPGLLADALLHSVISGRGLDWVVRRAGLLGGVSGEEVSEAARALFVPVTNTVVVLGDVQRDDLTRELS